MRGQVWQEYVVILAGLVLLAVAAVAYIYRPSTTATICATAYMRAASEITRQEFIYMQDYSIYGFECNTSHVNITCTCADPGRVGGAVEEVLGKFGISPTIEVTRYTG